MILHLDELEPEIRKMFDAMQFKSHRKKSLVLPVTVPSYDQEPIDTDKEVYTEYTHFKTSLSTIEDFFKRKEFHGLDLVRIATLDYDSFGMKKK